jgi:hypothetical protein
MTTWQPQYIPEGDTADPEGWYVRTEWDTADEVRMVLGVHSEEEAVRVAEYLNSQARAQEANEFLLARDENRRKRNRPRCFGTSSDALAFYGAGRAQEPSSWEYPVDRDDLNACELTFGMAPVWMRVRMAPVIEKYREAVKARG